MVDDKNSNKDIISNDFLRVFSRDGCVYIAKLKEPWG